MRDAAAQEPQGLTDIEQGDEQLRSENPTIVGPSADKMNSSSRRVSPSHLRSWRSRMRPALPARSGSRGKIAPTERAVSRVFPVFSMDEATFPFGRH